MLDLIQYKIRVIMRTDIGIHPSLTLPHGTMGTLLNVEPFTDYTYNMLQEPFNIIPILFSILNREDHEADIYVRWDTDTRAMAGIGYLKLVSSTLPCCNNMWRENLISLAGRDFNQTLMVPCSIYKRAKRPMGKTAINKYGKKMSYSDWKLAKTHDQEMPVTEDKSFWDVAENDTRLDAWEDTHTSHRDQPTLGKEVSRSPESAKQYRNRAKKKRLMQSYGPETGRITMDTEFSGLEERVIQHIGTDEDGNRTIEVQTVGEHPVKVPMPRPARKHKTTREEYMKLKMSRAKGIGGPRQVNLRSPTHSQRMNNNERYSRLSTVDSSDEYVLEKLEDIPPMDTAVHNTTTPPSVAAPEAAPEAAPPAHGVVDDITTTTNMWAKRLGTGYKKKNNRNQ